ncbi:MAG: hypothetical protein PHC51_00495 [bacterium]|nr:hypothetical protein [bacterium]
MTDFKEETEERKDGLPKLACCIVIDARFSSRQDLLERLRSFRMFDVVVEAKSFADGLAMLGREKVNVCVLGPTVSLEKAEQFIIQSKEQGGVSESCAYLVMMSQRTGAEAEIRRLAHGVVFSASSAEEFEHGLVQAVIKADTHGSWARFLNGERFGGEEVGRVLGHMEKGLSSFAKGLVSEVDGQQSFAADVDAQIDRFLEEIFGDFGSSSRVLDFRNHFRSALVSWVGNLRSCARDVADNRLRADLLAYRPPVDKKVATNESD